MTFGETVILHQHTAGPEDSHGNATSLWVDVEVDQVAVAPRQDEERRNTRDLVIKGLTLYIKAAGLEAAGVDTVNAADEFTVRGTRYRTIGEAGRWVNPFTGEDKGTQVALERVEG